jgi:hypothetical protein
MVNIRHKFCGFSSWLIYFWERGKTGTERLMEKKGGRIPLLGGGPVDSSRTEQGDLSPVEF